MKQLELMMFLPMVLVVWLFFSLILAFALAATGVSLKKKDLCLFVILTFIILLLTSVVI